MLKLPHLSLLVQIPGPDGWGLLLEDLRYGQQQFFAYQPLNGSVVADGKHWRVSPQASYTWGPFGLLAEYAISHQSVQNTFTQAKEELEHTAWQVSAQWVLTGEPASFNGITPNRPFRFGGGGWGAPGASVPSS